MPKVQAHAVFKGRVQGVGFRFTVERVALELGVVGWAKNLPDGNVEIVAEGKKEIIDEFLDKIRDYFRRYIEDEEIDIVEATAEFDDFQIKF